MNDVPTNPEPEEPALLLTIAEIVKRFEVSRTLVHTYRASGGFPQPVTTPGSTRLRFREDEVVAFFAAHPKRQGRRTDREPPDA